MATSGSSNFAATRADIIRFALRQVNGIARNETPSAQKTQDAAYALNALVKSWQAMGIHVWTETEGILFPVAGQVSYGLGGGATDRVVGSFAETAASASANAGDATLYVNDTSDIAVADSIGVQLDDGTLQWSTVASKTSTTVVLDDALTDSVSAGGLVVAYTSLIVRPLKIVKARRYNLISGNETPIGVVARQDYLNLVDKRTTGTINQIFYDPQLGTGVLYLWQAPTVVEDLVKFTWRRPIEDFDATGDNPDLPQEWIAPLNWNLALELASGDYPVDDRVYRRIQERAALHLDNVEGFDREEGSIFMQPGDSRYG